VRGRQLRRLPRSTSAEHERGRRDPLLCEYQRPRGSCAEGEMTVRMHSIVLQAWKPPKPPPTEQNPRLPPIHLVRTSVGGARRGHDANGAAVGYQDGHDGNPHTKRFPADQSHIVRSSPSLGPRLGRSRRRSTCRVSVRKIWPRPT